jgi:hypothetical protein
MEYYDTETMDGIVDRLDKENGHFSALLNGVIESAPFQKMRTQAPEATSSSNGPAGPQNDTKRVAKNE